MLMQLEGSHPRGVTVNSPNLNAEPILYKSLIAAFVVSSGDALRIDGLSGRRSVVTNAAAAAASLVPLAAFAELKKAGDAEIYKRADEGKLNAARVSAATSSRSIGPIDPPARIARLRLPSPRSLDLHVHRRSSVPRPATSSTARRPAAASWTS